MSEDPKPTLTRWTRIGDGPRASMGEYVCECGHKRFINDKKQRSARRSVGCGCHRHPVFLHRPNETRRGGIEGTPEYQTWREMRRRCTNPKKRSYHRYGGRGIKVCERWSEFDRFFEDMGPRPDGMTLDRIDNDGDYEPSNCRWATSREQNANRANNRRITIDGRTLCVVEWTRELGLHQNLFYSRLARGWTEYEALTEPVQVHKCPNAYTNRAA